MIRVAFAENPIRKDGSIVPRLVQRSTMNFDKVLSLMRLRTGLSESDMRSVFQHFADTLALFLPEGNQIQTPLGTFSISLKQVGTTLVSESTGATPTRSASTDRLAIRLRPDRALVARLKAATEVEVVSAPARQLPEVFSAENTEQVNSFNRGSAGEVLHISGDRLSFLKTNPQLGVFFVGITKPGETRVASYSRVGSNFVDCKVPVLEPGTYTLEVRTKPTDTDVRVGAMKLPFTVV